MSDFKHSIFEINSNKEHVIIGATYTVLSILVFPVYFPVIYALRSIKELNENISYKLINMLNLCDVIQSVVQAFTGIFIIFLFLAKKVDPLVRIMGYTANTSWMASFVIIAVLSLTRLGVTFFHTKATKWTVWQKILLFIGGLSIVVIWIIGCVTLNFELDGVAWQYDTSVVFTDILSPLEFYVAFPIMLLNFGSYLLILGNIYRQKRQSQNLISHRIEIGILIQAFVLTLYMALVMTVWHNAESWFRMTDITLGVLNGFWIAFPHLNAFLLIATNRSVRYQVLKIFGKSTSVTKVGAL